MKKVMVSLLVMVMAVTVAQAAVAYDYTYEADEHPFASTPVWTGYAAEPYPGTVSGGILEINTDHWGNNPSLYFIQDTAWNAGSDLSILDFGLKIISVSGNPQAEIFAMGMYVSDGVRGYGFGFATNFIRTASGPTSTANINTTSFRDYRIVLDSENDTATLYDMTGGTPTVLLTNTGDAGSTNRIMMGSYGSAYGGVSQLDYVRWANNVPEPATLGLLGIGGLVALIRKR